MSLRTYAANKYTSRNYNGITNPADDLATVVNNSGFMLKCTDPNTFTDASPNNFTITNNNSVTTSTSTVKFPNTVSAYFSAANKYLTVADDAALRAGTGSFTVAFYWYPTSLSFYVTPMGKGFTGSGAMLMQTGNSDGKIMVYLSGTAVITASTAVTVNTWNHIALIRNGTSLVLYLNGTSVGTATNSTNLNGTAAFGIGNSVPADPTGANGYIQDFFFTKTAVWTTAFTPPGSLTS